LRRTRIHRPADDVGRGGADAHLINRRGPATENEEAVMRRLIIVGVLVGAGVVVGSPALAAAPEIAQRSCEADGGSFSQDRGVKSCTTTSVGTVTTQYASWPMQISWAVGLTADYTGTVRQTDTVQTTTTRTQKGNGPVTTTTDTVVLSSTIEQISCHLAVDYFGVPMTKNVDPDVCEHPNDYPLEDLLF
jgi:hypothetical protein